MAPVIRISAETFKMLQKVAQPLVDTPDSAIRKALSAYLEGETRSETGRIEPSSHGPTRFNPDNPPDLTHASVLSGEVAGINVKNWNDLLIETHAQAYKMLRSDLGSLQRISGAHIEKGEQNAKGFRPVRRWGFSVQGVEAKKAWAISFQLAKELAFPIRIEFRWQQNERAAFPGKLGLMSWSPGSPESNEGGSIAKTTKRETPHIPRSFSAHIGGLLGSTYQITLREGVLTYASFGIPNAQSGQREIVITPTQEQWITFRDALDTLNVWDWRRSYVDRGVLDGTQWSFDIAYIDRQLKSEGSNSYPNSFKDCLVAIEKLLGGKTFR